MGAPGFVEVYDDAKHISRWIRADAIVDVAEAGIETCDVTWTVGSEVHAARVQESARSVLVKIGAA